MSKIKIVLWILFYLYPSKMLTLFASTYKITMTDMFLVGSSISIKYHWLSTRSLYFNIFKNLTSRFFFIMRIIKTIFYWIISFTLLYWIISNESRLKSFFQSYTGILWHQMQYCSYNVMLVLKVRSIVFQSLWHKVIDFDEFPVFHSMM